MAGAGVKGGQTLVRQHLQNVQQRTPEWLKLRANYLNASEFALAAGLITWQETFGRARLWERKVFMDTPELTTPKAGERMKHGVDNEEKGRREFSMQTGKKVLNGHYWTIDDKRFEKPWLGCSPDGLLEDGVSLLEVKCPFERLNKSFSYLHIPQVMGQLYVTGREHCYFINWTKTKSVLFKVTYNKEWTEKRLIPHLAEFWGNHVLPAKEWLEKNASNAPSYRQYYEQQSEIARYRPDIKPIGAETIVEECKTLARTNAVPYQAPGVGGALMVESSYNDTSNTIPAFLDAGDTEKSQ